KPGFLADTSLLNQDFSQKPGFFGASPASQKPGFLADTSLLNQDFSQKPGFFGASHVRLCEC
ncbi:hypothetical protein QUB67_03560, partial [Microcoleus sp. ARI1-A1]|uniref:hypothetical protein n=1 Tax=Microcoleus sp. ARI1-A1 TaxID=2818556 RepID=UPI002FD2B8AE